MESAWAAIIGSVVGGVVGGGFALFGAWLQHKLNLRERQRVAMMQIVSQLRQWLVDTMHVFDEASCAQPTDDLDPNRDVFPVPGDIPPFPFDHSLSTISLLQSIDAESLINVIAKRRGQEMAAEQIAFLRKNEEAAEIFEARIAKLYLECVEVHAKLAKKIGWSESAVSENGINNMRSKAANLREILNRHSDDVMD